MASQLLPDAICNICAGCNNGGGQLKPVEAVKDSSMEVTEAGVSTSGATAKPVTESSASLLAQVDTLYNSLT